MAKNPELYNAGLELFEMFFSSQLDTSEIEKRVDVGVDTMDRIRMRLGNFVFYAYDFRQGDEVRQAYETTLRMSKAVTAQNPQHVEHHVQSGTLAPADNIDIDIIGWYLTELPQQ